MVSLLIHHLIFLLPKVLIQLIAASEADRDIVYYTFNDQQTVDTLMTLWNIIEKEKLTVGDIYTLIVNYYSEISNLSSSEIKEFTLLEYFKTIHANKST